VNNSSKQIKYSKYKNKEVSCEKERGELKLFLVGFFDLELMNLLSALSISYFVHI